MNATPKVVGLVLLLGATSAWADAPVQLGLGQPVPVEQTTSAPAPAAASERSAAPRTDAGCGVDHAGCCATSRAYFRAEYLHWWLRDQSLPPLATTGNLNDARPGALGLPATRVVVGGSDAEQDGFLGGRFTAGVRLRGAPDTAVEGSFFFLDEQTVGQGAGSSGAAGSAVLSRPFFDISNNIENADPVALPLVQSGFVDASLQTELWGFELNMRRFVRDYTCCSIQWLAGFRFIELNDTLRITAATQDLPVGTGNRTFVIDQFGARNRFYGGQFGFAHEWRRGNWCLEAQGKLALGCTDQRQSIAGFRSLEDQTTGIATSFPAGLLAQPTNSGEHSRNEFSVVPELSINLGYQVTRRMKTFVGYSWLYWTEVARAGGQIDRTINTTQLPPGNLTGSARPTSTFQSTDFWAQGISVGLEIRY